VTLLRDISRKLDNKQPVACASEVEAENVHLFVNKDEIVNIDSPSVPTPAPAPLAHETETTPISGDTWFNMLRERVFQKDREKAEREAREKAEREQVFLSPKPVFVETSNEPENEDAIRAMLAEREHDAR
jgi:hypothetical protein